jgi:DNA-binding LacI/PurR family transcriptional regulator
MGIGIRDVASKSGVSICTVSYVLNNKKNVKEETRQKVLRAIKSLKYDPYRNIPLARQNTVRALGIVLPFNVQGMRQFYHRAISAAKAATSREKYDCLIYSEDDMAAKLADDYHRGRKNILCNGMIVFCPCSDWERYLEAFHAWEVPTVLIRRTTRVPGVSTISDDDYNGTCLVMEHLHKLGHQKVAMVGWNLDTGFTPRHLEAYHAQVKQYGMVRDERLVINFARFAEPLEQRLEEIMRSDVRPTAFMCSDDPLAVRVIRKLERLGLRVPRDAAVIGYDNDTAPEILRSELTTVNVPVEEMVRLGCKMLCDARPEGATGKLDIVCENTLIVRESCGYNMKPAKCARSLT